MILHIYVSYASDCLTDHLPHGEGLLCFTWLKALAKNGHKVYAYSPYANVKQQVPNLTVFTGGKKHFFPSLSPWIHAIESGKTLKKLLKKERIDVIWRMYPYGMKAPLVRRFGIPFIIGPLYSFYSNWNLKCSAQFGIRPSQFGNYFACLGWNKLLSTVDGFFTDTICTANDLKALYPQKEIVQLPAIIDPNPKIHEREVPNFTDELKLIFIGHFHPSKRLPEFCKIIYLLRERGYNAIGYIVGEGEELNKAISYCSQAQILDYVHFLGRVTNEAVCKLLSEMHFLLTLRAESYGRAIVEAMAVGTPNICVNKLAVTEFIENNISGILLADLSSESYVESIIELVLNPERWKTLSINSIRKTQEWTPEKISKVIEKTFTSIIKNKKCSS